MENMNCAVRFRRVCPRTWESLRSTEEASIRFCDSCQREVFLCRADDEAVQHAKQRHCIAKPMPSRASLRSLVLGQPDTPSPPLTARMRLRWRHSICARPERPKLCATSSTLLASALSAATRVPIGAPSVMCVATILSFLDRMTWAAQRRTPRSNGPELAMLAPAPERER